MTQALRSLVVLVATAALLLAPDLALAKAGGGKSMGSRGSMTYMSVPQAAPVQRSATPRAAPGPARVEQQEMPGASRPLYGAVTPQAMPQVSTGSPFLRGIAGGFLGAGLYSMLFGHSTAALAGGMPGAGMPAAVDSAGSSIGGILQILLFCGLGYLVFRFFKNRAGARRSYGFDEERDEFSERPKAYRDDFYDSARNEPSSQDFDPAQGPKIAVPPVQKKTLDIVPEDYQAFQVLLEKIQAAWGAADLVHLRQYVTPEMLGYFNEELSADTSRGLANKMEQVKFLAGNLIEAWSEEGMDYATVRMKWSALDYKIRLDRAPTDADYVQQGSATASVNEEEIWTFVRAQGGGQWVLSAIQQVV